MKCLVNIFAKFSPCENNHVYSIDNDFIFASFPVLQNIANYAYSKEVVNQILILSFTNSQPSEHLSFFLSLLYQAHFPSYFAKHRKLRNYTLDQCLPTSTLNFFTKSYPENTCVWYCLFVCPRNGIQGHLFFVLSVTLWHKNFNLGHNFWTVRDRDFIFGMHTNETLSNDSNINDLVSNVDDLVTLTVTFILKIAYFGLCCCRGHSCFTNTPGFFYTYLLYFPLQIFILVPESPVFWVLSHQFEPHVGPLAPPVVKRLL